MQEVVNSIAYIDGRRANVEIEQPDSEQKSPDRFVWVGLHEPSSETLKQYQKQFRLHDLAIEDDHNAHQRPKIETYGDILFIVLRTAQMNSVLHKIDFGETHFFVGDHFLLTVRHGSSISYTDVRSRCESTPHLLKKGQGFALYAVMDAIATHVSILGIEIMGDDGLLFTYAIIVALASFYIILRSTKKRKNVNV